MRLYLCADGTYAGTQDDARKVGPGWKLEEVPTDKAGLLDYLNANRHIPCDRKHVDDNLQLTAPVLPPPAASPGVSSLIEAEEFIQSADAVQLASLASNVCWRIKELSCLSAITE